MRQPELVLGVLQAIGHQAASGDETVLSAICRCQAHGAEAVRLATVNAIKKLAPQGHVAAVRLLESRLQAENVEEVQLAILLAVPVIMNRAPDMQQFFCILGFLGPRHSPATREAAARAAGSLAEPGSQQALTAIAALIGAPPTYSRQGITDSSPRVRRQAMRSLQHVLGGCKSLQVLSGIASRLQDTDKEVREEAVKAVALIAEPGDATVIRTALACLAYDCRWACDAGIQTLKLVGHGDANAIAGLLQHMADARVRVSAVQALLQVTSMQEALRSCISCVASPAPQMRSAVPECLRILLRQSKQSQTGFVSAALTRYLCHGSPLVRRAAVAAFGSSGLGKIPSSSLRAIGPRLLDRHQGVRAEATSLAGSLGLDERIRLLSPRHRRNSS